MTKQTEVPLCTTTEEFADWQRLGRMISSSKAMATFCSDCSFEHQSEMILQGKCSNPGYLFLESEE